MNRKPLPAQPRTRGKLYEAWFKCGCTKIAPRREITEYCATHGEDIDGLVTYTPPAD